MMINSKYIFYQTLNLSFMKQKKLEVIGHEYQTKRTQETRVITSIRKEAYNG